MDVQDITDEKFAEVLEASLLDAGVDVRTAGDDVFIDGWVNFVTVAKHFRRRITAEPILEDEVKG